MERERFETAPQRNSTLGDMVEERRLRLLAIVLAMKPMTVRQVFYQATVKKLVDKTERGYDIVQSDLTYLRENDVMPYDWLVDNTRRSIGVAGYKGLSVEEKLDSIREQWKRHTRGLWLGLNEYVEVWCEKDALTGVIRDVVTNLHCQLNVARGYASLSFLHERAQEIIRRDGPTSIYYLADYDPSGQNAADSVRNSLRKMAPNATIAFEKLAVTPKQIEEWSLPTRPTKSSDSRSKGFAAESVELDAIPPDKLRALVEGAIRRHLCDEQIAKVRAIEAEEREQLKLALSRL